MTPINGKRLPVAPTPSDPRLAVAEAVYTLMMDEGDPPFSDIDPEDLADILVITENYITAHVAWLTQQGFRLFPPGVTPIPTSAEEALAMVQAAKRFSDGQRRKSKLIGGAPKKLILPNGGRLN